VEPKLNGGWPTGVGVQIDDDGVINGSPEGVWSDKSLTWEIILPSRAQAHYDMVQQRSRSREFGRELERYRAAVGGGDNPRGLHNGDDNPAVDRTTDVRDGGDR